MKPDLNRRVFAVALLGILTFLSITVYTMFRHEGSVRVQVSQVQEADRKIPLPTPRYEGDCSVERALAKRRSVRNYGVGSLTLQEVSQLLWATQGVTDPKGLRTAPSAGGLYPLEVYIVAGGVESLDVGVYKYIPELHALRLVLGGDRRKDLCDAALGQAWVGNAPVNIIIVAVYERTTLKYGERGVRYIHMEVGHAAQNLCLQAVALNLGAVTVGAFHDERVGSILNLPEGERPLYIIPVGRLPQ
ncbi:MAG: SagB/ThcOx family dehydrogenase [Candidatus Bathyarchaeia archaeon]